MPIFWQKSQKNSFLGIFWSKIGQNSCFKKNFLTNLDKTFYEESEFDMYFD